jgi:hypothetical protein
MSLINKVQLLLPMFPATETNLEGEGPILHFGDPVETHFDLVANSFSVKLLGYSGCAPKTPL